MDVIVLPVATSLFPSFSSTGHRRRGLHLSASAAILPARRCAPIKCRASFGRTLSEGWDKRASVAGVWKPGIDELDSTNMLLRQRIIYVSSLADTATADFIISQLLFLDAEDQEKDIKLFINSPGGSVPAVMGIYDAMKLCKADISTICLGLAASMGAFLLAAGTQGKRFCMPNARVMIHQPYVAASGEREVELGIQLREGIYHRNKLVKILSRITGKSESQVLDDITRDYYMNPWEAKEYGLVDAVIDDGKPGLVAPIPDMEPPERYHVRDWWRVSSPEERRRSFEYLPSERKLLQKRSSDASEKDKEEQAKKEHSPV